MLVAGGGLAANFHAGACFKYSFWASTPSLATRIISMANAGWRWEDNRSMQSNHSHWDIFLHTE